MKEQQMEIRFDEAQRVCPRRRAPARPRVAQWWFARMRQVADQAWDWRAGPPARPQQTYLTLARPGA
jgi:hypothetical protein